MEDVLNMGSLPHIKWLLTNETQKKKNHNSKKKVKLLTAQVLCMCVQKT